MSLLAHDGYQYDNPIRSKHRSTDQNTALTRNSVTIVPNIHICILSLTAGYFLLLLTLSRRRQYLQYTAPTDKMNDALKNT
jgi:hypothetical protein